MKQLIVTLVLSILPLVALAEPIRITGRTELTFGWAAASGPVTACEARLAYADGTWSTSVRGLPPQTFKPRKGIPFKLSVRACQKADTGLTVCDGEWSEPTAELRLCPLRADIDCEVREGRLIVGARDFVILSHDWGQTVDEAPVDE